jgi:DNA-binding transcriptional ArsR family regulator
MTEPECKGNVIPSRGKPNGHFCWQQNEMCDLVQKVVGPTALAVYANLTRRAYGSNAIKCTVRELAAAMGQSHATVSRELTVLKYIEVVRVKVAGGNRPSEWELTDLRELAKLWGATYNRRTCFFELSQRSIEYLKKKVDRLRIELQGKAGKSRRIASSASIPSPKSERDTSVSPERQQRYSRGTQTVLHLIENRKQENDLSPTPFHVGEFRKDKELPDEGGTCVIARDLFFGVMDDLKEHLVNPGRPRFAHLDDGYEDWLRFGFGSLDVVAARGGDDGIVRLVLCSSDPSSAQAGLSKYRKAWDRSARFWFGCEVVVEWQ